MSGTGPIRAHLLAGVLKFVRAARQLPVVTRIALIGSLATTKHEPKDADLLVTVRDDVDLVELAALGRRLQGHAQQRNCGADVFLATPDGAYLGRTCPWRECRPGLRMRCDALHCGQRPHLHDDLQEITLPASLIVAPPIELWPEIVARVRVPADVKTALIAPLAGGDQPAVRVEVRQDRIDVLEDTGPTRQQAVAEPSLPAGEEARPEPDSSRPPWSSAQGGMAATRTVTADLADLVDVYGTNAPSLAFYLDLETGEVIAITDDIRFELRRLAEEHVGDDELSLSERLARGDLPDGEREVLLAAARIAEADDERYLPIPHADAHDDYRAMELFIESVADRRLQARLWQAIDGRGAFRRFRDVLDDHPREQERWYSFLEEQHRQQVLEWLASEQIELVDRG